MHPLVPATKVLYNLRKSFRWWFNIFVFKLRALNFISFNFDIYIFYNLKRRIYLVIYIDDFLITTPISTLIIKVKDILIKLFELKNLGSIKLSFRIRITYNRPN